MMDIFQTGAPCSAAAAAAVAAEGVFDAGEAFVFQRNDETADRRLKWSVHTIADMDAFSDVWLIDHAWEFDSPRRVRPAARSSQHYPLLRDAYSDLQCWSHCLSRQQGHG